MNPFNDQCWADRPASLAQKLEHCDFLRNLKTDQCQNLYDGISHRAVSIHATFSDLDHISRSQLCQTVLTKKFMFLSEYVK